MPPGVPESWLVIVVFAAMPVPVMVSPGTTVPDDTALTVSVGVVPTIEIEPVICPALTVNTPVVMPLIVVSV